MEERARALDALRSYRGHREWARRDPGELAIGEVVAVGPTQVILETTYEARGVRYELEAAPTRPQVQSDGPDPWSVRLEHPDAAPIGHEVSESLSGTTVHMDCGLCSATGEVSCPTCNGTGYIQRGRRSYTCERCHGRGEIRCDQCRGSGGLLGYPSIWSRIEQTRRVQVHESEELPLEVFLELQSGDQGGEVIHTQEADRIVDLKREGGYRDAAGDGTDPLREIVKRLGVDTGVPDACKIRGQRLEVRRVPAFEVRLDGGDRLWVYGDPPNVSPARAMDSAALAAARLAPWAVLALGVVGSGAYLWLS